MKDYSKSTIPRLYELLDAKGISQKQISEDTGISQSNFTEWKKGRSTPKSTTLAKIAEYLGVSCDLLTGSDSSESPLDVKIQIEYEKMSEKKKKRLLKYMVFLNGEEEGENEE